MYTSAQHQQVGAKVGLAFHVMRDKNGGPLYGDWTKGQFWMMTVPSGQTNELLYTSSVLSSTILPSTSMNFPWYAWAGSYWDSVFPGTGAMLYDDTSISALKGVLLGNGGSTSCLIFLPFADGTLNETQTDVNDFQVMEHGACIGLRYTIGDGTTYCGSSPNAFGY